MAPSTKLALANSLKKLLQKNSWTISPSRNWWRTARSTARPSITTSRTSMICSLVSGARGRGGPVRREGLAGGAVGLPALYSGEHMVIYHIYRSGGRDHLLDCPFHPLARAAVRSGLQACAADIPVSGGERDFLAAFYTHAIAGVMAEWFSGDMREPAEDLAGRLSHLLDPTALQAGRPRAVNSKSKAACALHRPLLRSSQPRCPASLRAGAPASSCGPAPGTGHAGEAVDPGARKGLLLPSLELEPVGDHGDKLGMVGLPLVLETV